jgi:predicted  nucleic acid-binding Zn-ribbon protein
VEQSLLSLARFQDLNLEVASLDTRLSAIPAELKAIDDKQEAARAVIAQAHKRLEESIKSRRDQEGTLQDLEQRVDKYNSQSREVKTNDQYRAIMSEIQAVKSQIGEVEEKILLAMEEADALEKEIEDAEKQVVDRKKEFDTSRQLLIDERDRVMARREKLDAERKALASEIRPDLMEAYKRMASTRGDVVLATIGDERCTECRVRLRPALCAEIRKNERIILCETCKRILYYRPPAESDEEESISGPS